MKPLPISVAVALCATLLGSTANGQAPASQTRQLFSDGFTTTTGLDASSWQVPFGSFTTDGSHAISGTPSARGNWAKVVPVLATNNYSVSADIAVPAGTLNSGLTVRSNATDFDNTLYGITLATNNTLNVYRRLNGAWTLLANASTTVTPNTVYTVKFLVSGDNPVHLEGWLNGALLVSYDDSSTTRIPSGLPGMQNFDAGVKYSNYRIQAEKPYVFQDRFNRTTGLGASWNVLYGSFSTNGTSAISGAPPNTGNWARVVPRLGTSDYVITADMTIPAGSIDSGIFARSHDSLNIDETLYAAQLWTDGNIHLYRRNTWAWTALSQVAAGITANTSYRVALVVRGNNPVHLEVWLDGSKRIDFDDASNSQVLDGGCGLQNYAANVAYRNLTVEALSPFPAGADVSWVKQVNTAAFATTLVKIGGQTGVDDAGAVSQQSIASGFAHLQFTIDDVAKLRYIGLTHMPNGTGAANIDFGFRIQNGHADVYENNVFRAAISAAVDDLLSIDVMGSSVFYFRNGEYQYVSASAPTYPLYAEAEFLDANATLAAVKLTGGDALTLPPEQGRVLVDFVGNGGGVVHSSSGINCDTSFARFGDMEHCSVVVAKDTTETLTVVPGSNSVFRGWSGACTGSSTSCTLTVKGNMAVFADLEVGCPEASAPYACGQVQCGGSRFPPACWKPFSPTSAFNLKVTGSAKRLANSDQIRDRLLAKPAAGGLSTSSQAANVLILTNGGAGWPTYWATQNDPTYNVSCDTVKMGGDCSVAHKTIHAPAGASMQGGDQAPLDDHHDRHMTLVDQSDGTVFDLWHVQTSPLTVPAHPPGLIPTDWGGVSRIDSSSTGQSGCVGTVCSGEGNAGRYGNLAGRIRWEEFSDAIANRGFINHALSVTIKCTNGQVVFPATTNFGMACSDKDTHLPVLTNENAPPMGARLHLNLHNTTGGTDADLSMINTDPVFASVPEWKKVLLRTLVVYGAIINDTGSGFYFNWQTESGNQYTSMGVSDPWLQFATQSTGTDPVTHQPYTGCFRGDPATDWAVDCDNNSSPDGYVGEFHANQDGITDWDATVWRHLEILAECVNRPEGC